MSYLNEKDRAILFKFRKALDQFVIQNADIPTTINEYVEAVRAWTPGVYLPGDVRSEDGIPYKCVQYHDSSANPAWTPSTTASLWMQYHGTSADSARAWVMPTGAHDQYLEGEYMIYTDGNVYLCLINTIYAPDVYPQAWQIVTI